MTTQIQALIKQAQNIAIKTARISNKMLCKPKGKTVKTFNKEFPLPTNLFNKWKEGIRLWPTCKSMKSKKSIKDKGINESVVRQLLKAKTIDFKFIGFKFIYHFDTY